MKGPEWDLRDAPEAKHILLRLVSYTPPCEKSIIKDLPRNAP